MFWYKSIPVTSSDSKKQLVSRGYDYNKITKAINTLASTPRVSFLEYKVKRKYQKPNTFFVSKFFDFNLNNSKAITNSLTNLGVEHGLINYFKPNIVSNWVWMWNTCTSRTSYSLFSVSLLVLLLRLFNLYIEQNAKHFI